MARQVHGKDAYDLYGLLFSFFFLVLTEETVDKENTDGHNYIKVELPPKVTSNQTFNGQHPSCSCAILALKAAPDNCS